MGGLARKWSNELSLSRGAKDVGIKTSSKKNWLMTGLAKTGKHGVKEADIKGPGTKPYTKQVVPLDTIKKKDMKDLKVKKLH